jgi:hypothetical protein
MQSTIHVYEVRPRQDKRGVDLISDALPFGRRGLRRGEYREGPHDTVIGVSTMKWGEPTIWKYDLY